MKYSLLSPLPNDGYAIAANFYGTHKDKILIGGGSGFIKPLADGGLKLLSNSIRLLSEENGKWIIHDEIAVKLQNEKYGFCNGVSITIGNKTYFIGGLKSISNGAIESSFNIIEVEVSNSKISHKLYENVLPFGGEIVGTQIAENKVFILSQNKAFTLEINNENQSETKFKINVEDMCDNWVNGALPISDFNKIYLVGGYKPFDANKSRDESNIFFLNDLLVVEPNNFKKYYVKNLIDNPIVTLGSSALVANNKILIIGGVNQEMFIDAIYNLSTLKDDELASYKKIYFNKSVEEFKFNKRLIELNLATNEFEVLGEFNVGFAGNPTFIEVNNKYYILSAEIKAGVRLQNPIKFEL